MLLDHFNLLDETFIRSRVPWSGKGIMTRQGYNDSTRALRIRSFEVGLVVVLAKVSKIFSRR